MSAGIKYCTCARTITSNRRGNIFEGQNCLRCGLKLKSGTHLQHIYLNGPNFGDTHTGTGAEHLYYTLNDTDKDTDVISDDSLNDSDHDYETINSDLDDDINGSDNDNEDTDSSDEPNDLEDDDNDEDNHGMDALGQNFAAALDRLSDVLGESARFKGGPYNGKNGDFDNFLSKYEQFCLANQKDDAYKRTHFPMQLEGRAYDLYESSPPAVKADWNQMVDNLKRFFSNTPLPLVQAFERLHALKMEPTESVQHFYEKIEKIPVLK